MNMNHIRVRLLTPEEITQGKIFLMLSMVSKEGRLMSPMPAYIEAFNDEDQQWYTVGVVTPPPPSKIVKPS